MRMCSQVCGVAFDPLDEDYVDVCEDCEEARKGDEQQSEERGGPCYYLGSCGLIKDYFL